MVPNHARYHLRYTPMQLFHYNDFQHGCQAKSHFSRRNICRFLFSEFLHLSAILSLDSGSARSYTKDAAVSPVLQTLLTTSLETGTSGLLFSFPAIIIRRPSRRFFVGGQSPLLLACTSRRANTICQPREFCYLQPVNGLRNSPLSVVPQLCPQPAGA